MPYSYPEVRKFLGLFAQANSFDLPDGAMEQANNIIIQNDNTVTKLNGFYTYYTPLSGTLVSLHVYQSVLMAVYTSKISYFTDTGSDPNKTGTITDLTGASFTVNSPRFSRSVQSNGNLYFTTDAGTMKIDAYTGKIFKSGTPPALDLRGNFLQANGPLNGDSEVGYRVVFGRQDVNGNLLLGAPSDILVLSNLKQISIPWSRTTNVVTVTSAGHNLASGMTITVSNSTGPAPVAPGTYTVTVVDTSTFTISSTAADDSGHALDYTVTRTPLLEFSVPRELTTSADNYFYQLHRTSFSNSGTASPTPNFRLVQQVTLAASDLTAGVVFYQDNINDVLLTSAPELYTNPNSQEGELQANARAPLADDIALFQNYVLYGNCTTRQVLEVDVVAPGDLVNNDYVEIKVDATVRRYVAKTGLGNQTVQSQAITNSGGHLSVSYTAHGFANGYQIYISTITGGTLAAGTYYVISSAANTFQISLTSGGTAVANNGETSLWFEGVTDGTNPIFYLDNAVDSVATQLRNTAGGLVKAINRDAASVVYANYISSITDTPGKMLITAAGFGGVIQVRANTTVSGAGFAPPLPSSFGTVASSNSVLPNAVYLSKVGEPEAVPLVNFLTVGSKNKKIIRILPLRDSVIVLKEDGVFKIVGDSPANFTSVPLDYTAQIVSANSAQVLNNQVYFLANQGICIATDSAVQIGSRRIERLITPIIGNSALVAQTNSLSYESNRTYRLCTLIPNGVQASTVYLHNTINDTWTTSDVLFTAGVVGPNNILYLVSTDGTIKKERKFGDRTDYCMQNFSATVVSVTADKMGATITPGVGYTPGVGDVVVKSSVLNRVRSVATSGSNYALTFELQTNLLASDSVTAYQGLIATVKMAPFHAGMVGRTKQFAQFQIHQRTSNTTRLKCSFQNNYFGATDQVTWLDTNVVAAGSGWGNQPWGGFAWGSTDGIDIKTVTTAAPIIRLWVPQLAQRATYIQPVLIHEEAGESMEFEAMSWAVRAYQERVTK